MPSYKITAVLEPAGGSELQFEDSITIEDIKITSKKPHADRLTRIIHIEFEVRGDNEKDAREKGYSEIAESVLPIIILLANAPYKIVEVDAKPVDNSGSHWIHVGTKTITVNVMPRPIEVKPEHILGLYYNLKKLEENSRKTFYRALKYWNRAMSDPDPIDRFLNLYIALEILAGELVNEEYRENKWVNALYNKFGFNGIYRGHKIHSIRAALLHYKNNELSKEEAERIIEKHVDEFAQEIFRLMKDYVECGGDMECLQKKRQPKSRS